MNVIMLYMAMIGSIIHGALWAKTGADTFIAFRTMEKSHEADWFEHAKKIHDVKYDLLKQQHAECADYCNQKARDWQNNNDNSAHGKDRLFEKHLQKGIVLHKKHIAQFKKMCDMIHEEAHDIQKRHEKELQAFIDKNVTIHNTASRECPYTQ
jgi:hypothetical protein